uniref:Uncharacterized protein n=1 Tax=Sphaerodactylus townsendi TaxID=933632 RepID=A0ACB8FUX5_9SAUR
MLALAERCLWVTAALSVLLQASASPILDYSGEEQSSEDPSSKPLPTRYSQLRNCVRLAKELRNRASQLWKKEVSELSRSAWKSCQRVGPGGRKLGLKA